MGVESASVVDISSSLAPIDDVLEQAAAERPGQPLKLRVQPTLLRHEAGRKSAHYGSWKNLHWTLMLNSVDEGRAVREALSTFFFLIGHLGVYKLRARLANLMNESSP
jgi:hypothetical protein